MTSGGGLAVGFAAGGLGRAFGACFAVGFAAGRRVGGCFGMALETMVTGFMTTS